MNRPRSVSSAEAVPQASATARPCADELSVEAHQGAPGAPEGAGILGHQDGVRSPHGLAAQTLAPPRAKRDTAAALRRRVSEQEREIRRLSRELVLAQRHERDHIARILHDEFQQLLYAVKIRLDAVAAGASMAVHGDVIRELVDQAGALTHTLVVSLTPPIYESDDLVPALDWLADYIGDRYGVTAEVTCDPSLPVCDEERRVLLFEAVRELLFNVVKHAGTDRARVSVTREAGGIRVVVEDEGQGFDPAAVRKGREEGGFGLPELRRRFRLLGGQLRLETTPGRGTCVIATVPLEEAP